MISGDYDKILPIFKILQENNYLSSRLFFLQKIPIQNCFWVQIFQKSTDIHILGQTKRIILKKKTFCIQSNKIKDIGEIPFSETRKHTFNFVFPVSSLDQFFSKPQVYMLITM